MATALKERSPDPETNGFGIDKIKRYGWKSEAEPGELAYVAKGLLHIDESYQREANHGRALRIASNWSYMSAGAITVARRLDGTLWAVDGQHRVLAAKKRSDIKDLPCIIFASTSPEEEAKAFIALNGGKPVPALAKHRAAVMARDPIAVAVQSSFDALGLNLVRSAKRVDEITCVAWANKRIKDDGEAFAIVLSVATELARAQSMPVGEKMLDGLFYLHANISGGIGERRLSNRLREVGNKRLLDAALRASAYYSKGGARVWAHGMLDELNKNLRNKFALGDGLGG